MSWSICDSPACEVLCRDGCACPTAEQVIQAIRLLRVAYELGGFDSTTPPEDMEHWLRETKLISREPPIPA